MHDSSNTIRQAALVLARLDRNSRDAVLEEMPPEQAEKIRCVLLNLDTDDASEQETAIREFLSTQRPPAPKLPSDSPALDQCGHDVAEFDIEAIDASVDGRPADHRRTDSEELLTNSIRDLLRNSDSSLSDILSLERPATVSALLSAIPESRAAGILKRLSADLRIKALLLLNSGLNPHPKAIEAVAEWICDHLAAYHVEPKLGLQHQNALKAILDEFSPEEREAMLDDIAQQNPMLARRLMPQSSSQVDALPDCYC